MPPAKKPEPLLRTPEDQIGKVETFKRDANMIRDGLAQEFRNEDADISAVAEQIAKSHGIYLEYNRAKTGREKDWMYMVRISVLGGGSFNAAQWAIIDDCADKYCDNNPFGGPSIRLTTRQCIQYHWIKKPAMISLVQDIAKTGFFTLNGCGDNTRNVMACPLSKYSDICDAHAKATEYGNYFQLPARPHIEVFAIDPAYLRDDEDGKKYDYGAKLLNRKFKISFSAAHRDPQSGIIVPDNCVELRANDMGIAPVLEDEKVVGYQVYVGGGQGEKNGKPTFAALGQPLGVFTEDNLKHGLHSIVKVHEEWGDRKNRHWARLKYVIHKQGIEWYRDAVAEKSATFDAPIPDFDYGKRDLHHGWTTLPTTGKLAYGAYIECGRLVDTEEGDDPEDQSGNVSGNGQLKRMVRGTLEAFPETEVMITPNQDLLFTNIDPDAKEDFEGKLSDYGYGQRKGKAYSKLRVLSGACVGLPTCRLSYTRSEQFEPWLLDQLDAMGYGDTAESIGITGCERQCFRPATKTLGWVGQGPDMYMLKLGGSEGGTHLGTALIHDDKLYMRQVKREDVPKVCAALIDFYNDNKQDGEDMGAYHRRVGVAAILEFLGGRDDVKHVLEKTAPATFLPYGTMNADAPCT